MKLVDMHIHTTASDGSFSPREIVEMALNRGMKAIAITDHSSVSGIDEALNYAKNREIMIVPGIEINCKWDDLKEIHVIGLFINHKNNLISSVIEKSKNEKTSIKEAAEAISASGGISILAHPGIYGLDNSSRMIEEFILCGGRGIEGDYPYDKICLLDSELSKKLNLIIKKIAKERNLVISGGSDFHGKIRPVEIGDGGLSDEEFRDLVYISKRL